VKIENHSIDLRTIALTPDGLALVNGRRRIEIREDMACVSTLGSPEDLRIGMPEEPELEYLIRCAPRGWGQIPFGNSGWLRLGELAPNHFYWVELRAFGAVSVEREDGNPNFAWCWRMPADTWRGIARCA
jgi:hypothetical protein